MKKQHIICVVYTLLICLSIICITRTVYGPSLKNTPYLYYSFPSDMSLHTTSNSKSAYTNVLDRENVRATNSYFAASIVLLHRLDDIHKLKDVPRSSKCKFIFGLKSIDLFASKATLNVIFGQSFPDHVPKTWIRSSKEDMIDLRRQFNIDGTPRFPMIIKQDVQRQTGLTLVKHQSDLNQSFVVCQKVLTNPLLVNNRKINLRIYLLVVCTRTVDMYMFNDGFVYYAEDEYTPNEVTFKTHITTGYVDRKIYETNPLTLKNLYMYLGKSNAMLLKRNVHTLMNNLYSSYKKPVELHDTNSDGKCHFAILGVDLAPDKNFGVTIMEINKGPDLKEKDELDGILKRTVIRDALKVCNIVVNNHSKHNFMKLF